MTSSGQPGTMALLDAPPVTSPVAPAESACDGHRTGAAPLRVEQKKLTTLQQGRYKFELSYPHFTSDDKNVEEQINTFLAMDLKAAQTAFVKNATEDDRAPAPENARWFTGDCRTTFVSQAFVSVSCDTMEGPGAHPNLGKLATNLEICPTVRSLALADLCPPGPECRRKVIELINADFRAGKKKESGIQFQDKVPEARGKGDLADSQHPVPSLNTFNITPQGIRFFLYDELPHVIQAFGVVDIPHAKLRPVLRKEMTTRIWGTADQSSRPAPDGAP